MPCSDGYSDHPRDPGGEGGEGGEGGREGGRERGVRGRERGREGGRWEREGETGREGEEGELEMIGRKAVRKYKDEDRKELRKGKVREERRDAMKAEKDGRRPQDRG